MGKSKSPRLEDVISHWAKLVEGLQVSGEDFFQSVEKAIGTRNMPDVWVERVERAEGGVLDAKREYLRVTCGPYAVEISAAPYGRGYFFSSWLLRRGPGPVIRCALGFTAIIGVLFWLITLTGTTTITRFDPTGFLLPFLFGPGIAAVSLIAAVWLALAIMAAIGRSMVEGIDEAMSALPLVGWIYRKFFAPITLYKLDLAVMFRAGVHAALIECVDAASEAKGLRRLLPEEHKPIMDKLL